MNLIKEANERIRIASGISTFSWVKAWEFGRVSSSNLKIAIRMLVFEFIGEDGNLYEVTPMIKDFAKRISQHPELRVAFLNEELAWMELDMFLLHSKTMGVLRKYLDTGKVESHDELYNEFVECFTNNYVFHYADINEDYYTESYTAHI